MTAVGFRRMITRLGKAAKMPFSAHPHMLCHARGFRLANDGPRHAGATALPRAQEHPAHGSLHRAFAWLLMRTPHHINGVGPGLANNPRHVFGPSIF